METVQKEHCTFRPKFGIGWLPIRLNFNIFSILADFEIHKVLLIVLMAFILDYPFISHLNPASLIGVECFIFDSSDTASAHSLDRNLPALLIWIFPLHFFKLFREPLGAFGLRVGVDFSHLIEDIFELLGRNNSFI